MGDLQRVFEIVEKGDGRTWAMFMEAGRYVTVAFFVGYSQRPSMHSRLLNVLESLVVMRERNIVSATLMSTSDQAEIKSCIARINRILAEFHFLLGVEIHMIVRRMEDRQLESRDEAQWEGEFKLLFVFVTPLLELSIRYHERIGILTLQR